MHWMQAERILKRLGLDSIKIKNEKLAIAEISIQDRCKSLLKAYHPDKGIESKSTKFQEISELNETIEKYGIKTIHSALNGAPKRRSDRLEILEKINEKLKLGVNSSSMINLSEINDSLKSGKYFFDLLKNTKDSYLILTNVSPLYRAKSITLENVLNDKKMRQYLSEELIRIGRREIKDRKRTIDEILENIELKREENLIEKSELKKSKREYFFLEKELGKSENYKEFELALFEIESDEAENTQERLEKILSYPRFENFVPEKKEKEIKKSVKEILKRKIVAGAIEESPKYEEYLDIRNKLIRINEKNIKSISEDENISKDNTLKTRKKSLNEFKEFLLSNRGEEAKYIENMLKENMEISVLNLGKKINKKIEEVANKESPKYNTYSEIRIKLKIGRPINEFEEVLSKIDNEESKDIENLLKKFPNYNRLKSFENQLVQEKNIEVKKSIGRWINARSASLESRLSKLEEEKEENYNRQIRLEEEKENLINLDIEKEYTIDRKFDKIKNPLRMLSKKIRKESKSYEVKLFNVRNYRASFMGDLNRQRYSTLASINFDGELNISYKVFENLSDEFAKENYKKTNRKLLGVINTIDLEKNRIEMGTHLQLSTKKNHDGDKSILHKETIKKLSFFNNIHNYISEAQINGNYALISVEFKDEQPIYRAEGIVASNFFRDFSKAITKNNSEKIKS